MNFESYTIFFILLIILLNLFLLSNLKWISKKIDVFDNPDNYRKIHTVPTPLLGGLFILTNLIFYCIFFIFLDVSEIKNSFHISEDSTIIFFLIISLIIFLIGFYDDAFLISSKSRIFILTTLVYFTVWLIDIIHINEVNFLFN